MPKVEQNSSRSSSIPISLHYALTDSQCNKCGKQLEWKADFGNINQPKYVSKHCNQDYVIRIDTVKVEIAEETGVSSAEEQEEEPRAIKMAQALQKQERESEQKIDVNPEKVIEEE